jgi:peptidoglycan biosynthesis protein MviN/MurJ (putative lipid II flippase)
MTKAISTPTVPRLAIAAKSQEWRVFRHIYRERLLWMLGITVLSALVLLFFGEPLLHLLIGHGGITAGNVRTLWWIMIALAGVMVGGTMGQVSSSAFYAMGDTKTPTNLFIVTFTIHIPIKVLVFMRYGLIGLAAVSSAHLILNFLLQLLVLERMTSTAQHPQ